jgi:hypothetical protein
MPDRAQFEALRLELLKGGVSPIYVERTILELSEHCEDLERDALAAGLTNDDASRTARTMLGAHDLLAAAVLARPELLSWSKRWPTLALLVRSAAAIGVLPALPVLYCVDRGEYIARWGSAIGAAVLLVGLLLAGLNWMITMP